jgi:hypothetical protein
VLWAAEPPKGFDDLVDAFATLKAAAARPRPRGGRSEVLPTVGHAGSKENQVLDIERTGAPRHRSRYCLPGVRPPAGGHGAAEENIKTWLP